MTQNPNNMEEKILTIYLNREQLLFIAAVIILAGIASNYSTVSPSTSHALVAKCAAEDLLNRILK